VATAEDEESRGASGVSPIHSPATAIYSALPDRVKPAQARILSSNELYLPNGAQGGQCYTLLSQAW